eukprot:TRINITY_DN67930_c1_g2_i1.p1 TRINITY_DN67930_c1_g2~~TRINITY_DN67930_c1_g2_i1.p1  ORF type:complete len:730 (+),score=73.77 TRINITY_DN67930_c1_g2_i1:322-2190(+)
MKGDTCWQDDDCHSRHCYKGKCGEMDGRRCSINQGAVNNPSCPQNTICGRDNYCHKIMYPGSKEECGYDINNQGKAWTQFTKSNQWDNIHPICLGRCVNGRCNANKIGDSCQDDSGCAPYRCNNGKCAEVPKQGSSCDTDSDCRGMAMGAFGWYCKRTTVNLITTGKCIKRYSEAANTPVDKSYACAMGLWWDGTKCVNALACNTDSDCMGSPGDHFRKSFATCPCPTVGGGVRTCTHSMTPQLKDCRNEISNALNWDPSRQTDADTTQGKFTERLDYWAWKKGSKIDRVYSALVCCLLDRNDPSFWPDACGYPKAGIPSDLAAETSWIRRVTQTVVEGDVFMLELDGRKTVPKWDSAEAKDTRAIQLHAKVTRHKTCSDVSPWLLSGNLQPTPEAKHKHPMGKVDMHYKSALLRAPACDPDTPQQDCHDLPPCIWSGGACVSRQETHTYGVCVGFDTPKSSYNYIGEIVVTQSATTDADNETLLNGHDNCASYLADKKMSLQIPEAPNSIPCGCYVDADYTTSTTVTLPIEWPVGRLDRGNGNRPNFAFGCCEPMRHTGGKHEIGFRWGVCVDAVPYSIRNNKNNEASEQPDDNGGDGKPTPPQDDEPSADNDDADDTDEE